MIEMWVVRQLATLKKLSDNNKIKEGDGLLYIDLSVKTELGKVIV